MATCKIEDILIYLKRFLYGSKVHNFKIDKNQLSVAFQLASHLEERWRRQQQQDIKINQTLVELLQRKVCESQSAPDLYSELLLAVEKHQKEKIARYHVYPSFSQRYPEEDTDSSYRVSDSSCSYQQHPEDDSDSGDESSGSSEDSDFEDIPGVPREILYVDENEKAVYYLEREDTANDFSRETNGNENKNSIIPDEDLKLMYDQILAGLS